MRKINHKILMYSQFFLIEIKNVEVNQVFCHLNLHTN
jgi:hypothetical protein